jgi:hypothetical protein
MTGRRQICSYLFIKRGREISPFNKFLKATVLLVVLLQTVNIKMNGKCTTKNFDSFPKISWSFSPELFSIINVINPTDSFRILIGPRFNVFYKIANETYLDIEGRVTVGQMINPNITLTTQFGYGLYLRRYLGKFPIRKSYPYFEIGHKYIRSNYITYKENYDIPTMNFNLGIHRKFDYRPKRFKLDFAIGYQIHFNQNYTRYPKLPYLINFGFIRKI